MNNAVKVMAGLIRSDIETPQVGIPQISALTALIDGGISKDKVVVVNGNDYTTLTESVLHDSYALLVNPSTVADDTVQIRISIDNEPGPIIGHLYRGLPALIPLTAGATVEALSLAQDIAVGVVQIGINQNQD